MAAKRMGRGRILKKTSLLKQYFILAVGAPLLLVSLVMAIGWYNFTAAQEERNQRLSLEGEKVQIVLEESVRHLETISRMLADRIQSLESYDPDEIAKILTGNTYHESSQYESFSWTFIDFIDPSGRIVANSSEGRIYKNIALTDGSRAWLKEARRKPWQLLFSEPIVGYLSKETIIPTGFGVTNQEGKFIGIISMGLNLKRLTSKITTNLSDDMSFAILDGVDRVVSSSSHLHTPEHERIFLDKLNKDPWVKASEGLLEEGIEHGDITFHYYATVKPMPYIILVGENNAVTAKEFKRMVLPQIILTIAIGIMLAILFYFFDKKIVHPVIQLSDAAIAISDGEHDVIIPEGNAYELDMLAKQLRKIEGYTKELRDTHVQLQKALSEAQDARRAKANFMAILAYEMKVPAHKVIAHAEYLIKNIKQHDPNNPLVTGWQEVAKTARFIQALVADLLDYAQSDGDDIVLHTSEADLKEILDEVVEMLCSIAGEHLVEVDLDTEDIKYLVKIDVLRMKQILSNVLSQSVYDAPRFSEIHIKAHVNKRFVISITDNHSKEEQKVMEGHIRNPFYSSHTQEGHAPLFGLSIAQKLIELHGGRMVFSRSLDGEHSTTNLIFPNSCIIYEKK